MEFYPEKLRFVRQQKNFTIEKLSKIMEINRMTLYRWERGEITPSEHKIRTLAKALNVPVNEISDLEPEIATSDIQYSKAVQSWISLAENDKEKGNAKIDLLMSGVVALKEELNNANIIVNALRSSISSIFYIKDTNLNYITANAAFLENLSLSKHFNVLHKTDDDLFSGKEAKINNEEDRQVLLTGKSILNKERYIPGSRRKKWGLISKIPIFDNEKKIEGIVASFIDITERKRTEYMRELLEYNINLMQAAISIFYIEGNQYLYLNKGIEEVFGYKLDNFYTNGRDFWLDTCVHPDDRTRQSRRINSVENTHDEYRIIKPDGEVRWVNVIYSTKIFENRQCMLSISQDITEKVNAEKRRELLENVINSAQDVFWIAQYDEKKKDYNYLFSSQSALKRLYDFDYREKNRNFEKYIENLPLIRSQQINKLIKIPSAQFPLEENAVITRADGEKRVVNRRVFKQPEDNIYFGITRDITEEKRHKEEKEILYELLSKSEDAISIYDMNKEEIIYMNDTVEKLTGYPVDTFYKDAYAFVDKCVASYDREILQGYRHNKTWPPLMKYRIIRPDGKIRICESRSNINDVFGRQCVIFIIRDITEKEESAELKQIVLDTGLTSEGVIIVDKATSKYLYINKAIENIYGYPLEEFYKNGSSFWLNTCLHHDDKSQELEYLNKKDWPKRRRFRIIKPDGKVSYIESLLSSEVTYKGEKCVIIIDSDITEKVNYENRIKELEEELKVKSEA